MKRPLKHERADGLLPNGIGYPFDINAPLVFFNGAVVPHERYYTSLLTHAIHYGSGLFEGIRLFGSEQQESYFLNLEWNAARLIYSSVIFSGLLGEIVMQKEEGGKPKYEKVITRGMDELFDEAMQKRKLTVLADKNGKIDEVELYMPAKNVNYNSIFRYHLRHIMAAIQATAIANDFNPQYPAYLRPVAAVGSEGGLKLYTIGRPMIFGVSILPWGRYLREEDYVRGITVMVSPYPRIGEDLEPGRKIAANYVNSQKAVDSVLRIVTDATGIDFGEVLMPNNSGKLVEGSAENLFFIVNTNGREKVYTPPLGNILPGTTRYRMLNWFKENGYEVKEGSFTFQELKELGKKLKGIFFTGTGAQVIHVKEIHYFPELKESVKGLSVTNRRNEINPSRIKEGHEKILINNGEQPQLVEIIRKQITGYGRRTPPYELDIWSLAEIGNINKRQLVNLLDLFEISLLEKGKLLTQNDPRGVEEKYETAFKLVYATMRKDVRPFTKKKFQADKLKKQFPRARKQELVKNI